MPSASVEAEAANAAQAMQWLQHHTVDVALIDIRMPGADGLALACQLKTLAQPPAVVFVTAHTDYAVQAFELAAVDYLTKQVIEALFHSRHVEEVYAEDHTLRKTLRDVMNRHLHVDDDLDQEVRRRIKNLQEGTQNWEVEYHKVMQDLKRLKGLEG